MAFIHTSRSSCSWVAVLLPVVFACLVVGCATTAVIQDPSQQRVYKEALSRKAEVVAVTVSNRPLTAEELVQQAEERRKRRGIIVTAGPLTQPYEVLGEVHADTTDLFLTTSFLRDSLFRSPFSVAVQGASPKLSYSQMDERLRNKAVELYGTRVDAVINVTYRTDPDGHVFADGLAVRFTPQPPSFAPVRSAEESLKELRGLLDQGLITQEEYERKREEILNEL